MNHIKLLIVLGVMFITISAGAHLMNVAKQMQQDRIDQINEVMGQMR